MSSCGFADPRTVRSLDFRPSKTGYPRQPPSAPAFCKKIFMPPRPSPTPDMLHAIPLYPSHELISDLQLSRTPTKSQLPVCSTPLATLSPVPFSLCEAPHKLCLNPTCPPVAWLRLSHVTTSFYPFPPAPDILSNPPAISPFS